MKKLLPSIVIGFIFFAGCRHKTENDVETSALQNLMQNDIKIDTLILPNNSFSGNGFLKVIDDNIVFFDRSYYLVDFYDTAGYFVKNTLGLGTASNEIDQFQHYIDVSKDDRLFFGLDYIFRRYNSNWIKKGKNIEFGWNYRKALYKGFNADDASMYDFNWPSSPYSTPYFPVDSKKRIYFPVNVIAPINPVTNKYVNSIKYFEEVHTIGVLDSKTGVLKEVFGNYPKVYTSGKHLTHYAYAYLDLKNDSVFVSYPADPKIYVYDPDHNVQYSFGIPGRGLRTNYPSVSTLKEYKSQRIDAELNYGYYTNLYIDQASNMVFRFYNKGSDPSSGMQIYKNRVLIYDIDVPKKFLVIGKIGDYFYANGIVDPTNDKLGVYRFKIK